MTLLTDILSSATPPDPRDADQLLPLVYDELRRLAAQRLAHEPPGQTREPTALVHEAYLRQSRYADAEKVLGECLAIREKKEPAAWSTFDTKSMLGDALRGQQKYTEAEPLLLQGYEGMKKQAAKIPPPNRHRLTEALEPLVRLYDAWGKPAAAAKWRRELGASKATAGKPAE